MIPEQLSGVFNALKSNEVRYAILKKFDVFPENIDGSKDIDLIIHPNDKNLFHHIMRNSTFSLCKHPWDFGENFIFLYSMTPLEFYIDEPYSLDICFELSCRSLNNGEWIPLHQKIQNLLWSERRLVSEPWFYEQPYSCELLHLITKAIFDKKYFPKSYQERINELLKFVDLIVIEELLNQVFYKYTPKLIDLIASSKFEEIFESYITFTDY